WLGDDFARAALEGRREWRGDRAERPGEESACRRGGARRRSAHAAKEATQRRRDRDAERVDQGGGNMGCGGARREAAISGARAAPEYLPTGADHGALARWPTPRRGLWK